MKRQLMATATAVACALGTFAQAATVEVDLGFVIDESGSVGLTNYQNTLEALKQALTLVPDATDDVRYTIGVVAFSGSAETVVAPTVINDASDLAGVLAQIEAEKSDYAYGLTNFNAAINEVRADWTNLGDVSILNFASDGDPTAGGAYTANGQALAADGWDAINFEAIGNFVNTASFNFGFETDFTKDPFTLGTTDMAACDVIGSSSEIVNPLSDCFIVRTDFADLVEVYKSKVLSSILTTGGTPNPVPVPAALPLLAGGLGIFGFMGWRRRKDV